MAPAQLAPLAVERLAGDVPRRAAVALARVELFQPALHRRARHLLQARVEGRRDRGPRLERRIFSQLVGEDVRHDVDLLGRQPARRRRLARQADRLGGDALGGLAVDEAVVGHLAEHVALARLGRVRVLARRQPLRALRQAGQQRRLGQVDLLHRLAEVVARRLLAAVAAVAVIDLVEVEREDLLLRQLLGQPAREDDLLHLALHRALGREQQGLDHLLRDRRAALRRPPAQHVLDEGARHAHVVDAAVLEVVGVLGGDHRLDEHLRDRSNRGRRCASPSRARRSGRCCGRGCASPASGGSRRAG